MLSVKNLSAAYDGVIAVRDLSLEVAEGETVALVGPNGAGKTTTLAAIAGLLVPTAGEVLFRGESLAGRGPEKIAQLGLQLVPEGRRIFGRLTTEENLRLGHTVVKSGDVRAKMEKLIERFPGLQKHFHSSGQAGFLSGGEQQQLAIARALMAEPALLLLDEPSLGLSPRMVELVYETLQGLRNEGTTILLVEQTTRLATQFADRVYVLRSGSVRMEGDRSSDAAEIEQAYFGTAVG
ncbi:MAG TPA: ABC transporter ATP-binding protein [Thermoleophilaceae bacterium]|nr:ABC transporter ATP-binding protein [Thermoleophilaceae bacterium]